MLCQGIASLAGGSELGDSGAPVFRITNSPLYGDVSLYGILWGGDSENDEIVYSTMSRIQNSSELGSIKTCALEIGC